MSYQQPQTFRSGGGGGNGGSGASPSLPGGGYGYLTAGSSSGGGGSNGGGSGSAGHRGDDERLTRSSYGANYMGAGPSPYGMPAYGGQYSPSFQYSSHQQQQQPPLYQATSRPPGQVFESEGRYAAQGRYGNSYGIASPQSPSRSHSSSMAHPSDYHLRSQSPSSGIAAAGAPPYQGKDSPMRPDTPTEGKAASVPIGTSAARVAKACVPCSTKKRRCDGGKPECKVCTVLGTPCSYENRGLKRGPPKGFRAGPKESAKAKLLRNLETIIRDLSQHIGPADASAEIARISSERGVSLPKETVKAEPIFVQGGRRSSKTDLDIPQRPSTAQKRAKRESSAPTHQGVKEPISAGLSDEDDSQEEEVLGINEQGNVRHFGSSSGIQLLQQRPPHLKQHHSDTLPTQRSIRSSSQTTQPQRTPSSSGDWRSNSSPSINAKPPIPLPSVQARVTGGSGTSSSFSPQMSPGNRSEATRPVSREMNSKLFAQFWTLFHNHWPVLYKPGFDNINIDLLPSVLDGALLNAIYCIGACVASPSLDSELESELGDAPPGEVFAQRAEAQLFQRMSPPLPTLSGTQTCFLLSLYNQGAGQMSKAYLFCSLAVGMAIDLGLHRHLRHHDSDLIERESRSRLIHCIHILSTLLAAEMGRPPMLRGKDIDVPLLSETEADEFEVDAHGRTLHSLSCLNCSRRLFGIIETVLTQVHSFRRKAMLRRMGSQSQRKLVEDIHKELVMWRTTLPLHLQMPPTDGSYDYRRERPPLPSYAAVHVWYHTAMLLLHRPFIPHDEGSTMAEVVSNPNHRHCTYAAQELFELLSQLSRSSDVDRLSTDLAYVIFTAAVMFVFNSRLAQQSAFTISQVNGATVGNVAQTHDDVDAVTRLVAVARGQFSMCKEWLKGLAERWPAASAHRQLLDGFASIGEGVIEGEGATDRFASRPTTSQGAAGQTAYDFASTSHFDPQHPGYSHSFFAPYSMETRQQERDGVEQGSGRYGDVSNSLGPEELYGKGQYTAAADGMPSAMSNMLSIAPSQQALSAYFDLAPNIFDMENVFWNETSTRFTPYLGPVTDANIGQAPIGRVPQHEDQRRRTQVSEQGPNDHTQQQPRRQESFSHSRTSAQQQQQPQPQPQAQSSGSPINLLSPRAQFIYTTHRQKRESSNDEVQRRSSSLRPGSRHASFGSQATSGSRNGSVNYNGNSQALNGHDSGGSAHRNSQRASFPDAISTRNSSTSGLAMLAQQAQAMTSNDQIVSQAPSTSMGAPPLPHNSSRAVQGGKGQANNAGSVYSQPQQAQHASASYQAPSVSQATGNGGSAAPAQPTIPNFSPFSLHQEPSAPEWGDVMSMLQLPPAFSQ